MRLWIDKRGLTLVETVIYTGILSVLLSAFLGLSDRMVIVHARNSLRSRLAESAWLALNTVVTGLETAESVNSTDSIYNTDLGTLVFTDSSGIEVVVDTTIDSININGSITDITRLHHLYNGLNSYITDSDLEVYQWEIIPVRDSDGVLTGLTLMLGIEVIDRQTTGYRQGRILYTATADLSKAAVEL